MRRLIPAAVLAVVAEITSSRETHASLDNLFSYAGAPGEPPEGSKAVKAQAWLRLTNKDETVDPLAVLGKLLEVYMEEPLDPNSTWDVQKLESRQRIQRVLAQCQLRYVDGGRVTGALAAPSRTLEEFIRDRDIASVDDEFSRALINVETNPREAVSAASNILESICKVYIAEENIEAPAKLDLKPVWSVVRKHLGFDPGSLEDQDLQQILSGIISVVDGIGALRTHASSAHGAGKKSYRLEPRHARLAVHSAHTVALFILESWQRKRAT
ncbi:abortive infection family protein [Rubrivivax gelatinosus]|uniref:Abortive infection Abi-like protein n=1 Tax=Rubrivivax gelatinosus TaxID=28068 RepID=A0A4R2MCM1_RUBGE|nr:abortive infection family protein [Rubrivivax gelatinosus]MBK1688802.1 ATP-dependent RNA helicase HrpA [Rubrivivax gelatinosus]TCP02875.1 abortive infection Abi-like protein [Rubrivivax gelatinosus]